MLDVKHAETNKHQHDVIITSRLKNRAVSINLTKKSEINYINPFSKPFGLRGLQTRKYSSDEEIEHDLQLQE